MRLPLTGGGEIRRVPFDVSCFVESIFKRHDRGSDEEVSEEKNKDHRPDDREVEVVPHERHGVLLTHHSNNLLLKSGDKGWVLGEVWTNEHQWQKGESYLHRDKQHHEKPNNVECPLDNQHQPVNHSEDSQRAQKIENIDHDDERVHLILLHIQVCEMDHLDVLFLIVAFVIVFQNTF